MKHFKKINLILLSALFCLSSCREIEENQGYCGYVMSPEHDFTSQELFDRSDFVYLIELGDILGSWYTPIFDCGTTFDVWGYTIIESYKGTTDNYYMFVPRWRSSKIFTGSLYYVFLRDYAYLDDESGFPDYFISLDLYYPDIGIYPAEDIGE